MGWVLKAEASRGEGVVRVAEIGNITGSGIDYLALRFAEVRADHSLPRKQVLVSEITLG
jgi:hypothetical protein